MFYRPKVSPKTLKSPLDIACYNRSQRRICSRTMAANTASTPPQPLSLRICTIVPFSHDLRLSEYSTSRQHYLLCLGHRRETVARQINVLTQTTTNRTLLAKNWTEGLAVSYAPNWLCPFLLHSTSSFPLDRFLSSM